MSEKLEKGHDGSANVQPLISWQHANKMKPPILQDFHDQKDLFKALFDLMPYDDNHDKFYRIDWIRAQIFVLDKFLPFMAMHGYTLKTFKNKVAECFKNMLEDIEHG